MAMTVLSGIIVALFLSTIPTLLLIVTGILHPSVFKMHVLFELLLAVGVSFGLNVIFVGSWCFNGLFHSINRRIVVAILLSLWFAIIFYSLAAPPLELGLTLLLLARTIWVKAHGSVEKY